MIKLSKLNGTLLLILALALLVRLWGIDHGMPFIYHPDEPALVRSAYGLRFGNLNPGHFDWPHLHYYLCFFIFESFIKFRALLQVLNLRSLIESVAPLLWQDPAIFYFLARLVSAIAGVATVGLTYFSGKKLFDKKTGLVAALFLSLSTLHVDQSHYALLDVSLTFWITLSFLFSILVLEKGRIRDCLLAGLFAGFAASTKYHGALVVISIIVAHFLRVVAARRISQPDGLTRQRRAGAKPVGFSFGGLLLAGIVAIAGFLIGTPYALLDRKTFLFKEDARGFLWQLQNMQGHLGAEAANGWWFHFSITLRRALGPALLGLAVLGILLALYRHRRRDLLLLSFPIFYFLYVGSWTVVYGRFMIPILPMLCLLAAGAIFPIVKKFKNSNLVLGALAGLALLQPTLEVVRDDRILTQTDTRTLAKSWIDENLPSQSKIAMDTIYGYFLDPFYLPNLRKATGQDDPEKGFYLFPWSKISETTPHEDPQKFLTDWQTAEIDYLITSSLVYGRYFSESTEELRPGVKNVQTDYNWFDENFKLLKEISPENIRPGPTIKVYQVTK